MRNSKVVTLEEAIKRSGLQNGMTISFHHHFRGGDKVVNMVVDKLAEMGFKDLKLAASSLSDVHAPLIDHIKNGVITGISTSGLRGALADAISHGLLKEPVVFRSHGGRGSAIAKGELKIDVAFLGAPSSDELGNACGYSRSENAKSICGSLGYALPDARYARHVVVSPTTWWRIPTCPCPYRPPMWNPWWWWTAWETAPRLRPEPSGIPRIPEISCWPNRLPK